MLTGVDHSMRCMREETFGPTLPVMAVADAEEAVELANDGPYRLHVFGCGEIHVRLNGQVVIETNSAQPDVPGICSGRLPPANT